MSVDERRRLDLAEAAKRALGDDAGITLMELLPPVGWADVATKHDLRHEIELLRKDLEKQLERGFRQVIVTMSALLIGGFLVAILAVVASALLG